MSVGTVGVFHWDGQVSRVLRISVFIGKCFSSHMTPCRAENKLEIRDSVLNKLWWELIPKKHKDREESW